MRIKFEIKIEFEKFQTDTILDLVQFDGQTIQLLKYGHIERRMNNLNEADGNDLSNHWDKHGDIIIKGKNKFFLSLSTHRNGQIYGGGTGEFSRKAMASALADLIKMLLVFNKNNALIFAIINTEELHNQRHKHVINFKSGGSATRSKGCSITDFRKYLPGVCWFNFFGKDYLEAIGRKKLENIELVTYIKQNDEAIAFHHSQEIQETELLDLEKIEHQIGSNYFYGRDKTLKTLDHPEGFENYLDSLEENFIGKYINNKIP